jgi:hypothetical protein
VQWEIVSAITTADEPRDESRLSEAGTTSMTHCAQFDLNECVNFGCGRLQKAGIKIAHACIRTWQVCPSQNSNKGNLRHRPALGQSGSRIKVETMIKSYGVNPARILQ